MNKPLTYMLIDEVIPPRVKPGTILNINTRKVTSHTHGFHKYPAKFIPNIPKWAIEKYLNGSKDKTILDPFCGSGTTLVEGILAGYNVIGIDIDPLSAMITRVKTTRVDAGLLNKISSWLVKEIRGKKRGDFNPDCETIGHWFTRDAIKKLSNIRSLINQIPEEFDKTKRVKDIQDLLLVCFSSIIRRVSNADNESQKTYVSHTNVKKPEEVYSLFFSQLALYLDRATTFSVKTDLRSKSKIICSSSTELLDNKLKGESIDLVITSPPYIKAIDYIYNQMVELFWIGDLFGMQTQMQQNNKKKKYIGNKHFQMADYSSYTPYDMVIGISELDLKLQEVYERDKKNGHRHSYVTFKYFSDMERHFVEAGKNLKSGTPYVIVIGDSTVSNVRFDTADYIIEIAERNGFRKRNKWGYKIKNRYMRFNRKGRGGLIEIDWVVDLKKI